MKYPPRAQQVIELIERDHALEDELFGAEIGVYRGAFSAALLDYFPNLQMILVDTWVPPHPDSEYAKLGDNASRITAEEHEANYRATLEALAYIKDADRFIVLRTSSYKAAMLARHSAPYDFIFIDGDHSVTGVTADLWNWRWSTKGISGIYGHDYLCDTGGRESVKIAVDEFARVRGLTVKHGKHAVWWLE